MKAKGNRFPDGTEIHEHPGATIDVAADGSRKQTNEDGSIIEIFPDGKKRFTSKDGEVKEVEIVTASST